MRRHGIEGCVFALGITASGCSPPTSETSTVLSSATDDVERAPEELAFRHPLQTARGVGAATGLQPGVVPIYDAKDSPRGRRYAMVEGVDVDEDGARHAYSGVVELHAALTEPSAKPVTIAEVAPFSRISTELSALIAKSDPKQELTVAITVVRSGRTLTDRFEEAIARGFVATRADAEQQRATLVQERQVEIANAQAAAVAAVQRAGGTIVRAYSNVHAMMADIPAGNILAALEEPTITRIETLRAPVPETPSAVLLREAQQLDQFIDNGFNGERGSAADVYFALIEEGGGIDEDIYAFRDGTGTSTRYAALYNCNTSCTSTSGYSSPSDHTTRVAGILFGDLQDGQDSSVTSSSERKRRSGFATEAHGYFYRQTSTAGYMEAVDHINGITSNAPILVNISMGFGEDCSGQDYYASGVNELFENGILTFKSAGNTGGHGGTACTVTTPGGASGSFTVGAYGVHEATTADDVRTAPICGTSAQGTSDRTILDLVAYSPRDKAPDLANTYTSGGCATSWAAPAAAGAAIDLADHHYTEFGDFLENPGRLHALMLLMGDREGEGSKLTSGFNRWFGAGRMRMRLFDEEGLDNPWGYTVSSVCVDHLQDVDWDLHGGTPISGDVNVVKVVAWWYDTHLERGSIVDDVDLSLYRDNVLVGASTSSYDEKERVFYNKTDNNASVYRIRFSGYTVGSDDAGCGTNSMLVHFAAFYEDSDRDDSSGLANIWPE